MRVDHHALVGVDTAQVTALADWLEGELYHALRVGTAWSGRAVDTRVVLPSFLMVSMVRPAISSENASPLILLAY